MAPHPPLLVDSVGHIPQMWGPVGERGVNGVEESHRRVG